MNHVLTPKNLARAIGVSESSLKRWADEGMVRATRTAGGHRRILLPEAIRFVRSIGATVVRPDLLGLSEVQLVGPEFPIVHQRPAEAIAAAVEAGDAARTRGMVQALYLAGWSIPAICDGPLREAMHRVGKLWQHAEWGIVVEHRATDICLSAVTQLRLLLPAPSSEAPTAIGCALGDDPYQVPSLMAAATVAEVGFADVNLGPVTPETVLGNAVRHYRPRLVWVSVSVSEEADETLEAMRKLDRQVRELGSSMIVGGRALSHAAPSSLAGLNVAHSMAELAAFAKGLWAEPRQSSAAQA